MQFFWAGFQGKPHPYASRPNMNRLNQLRQPIIPRGGAFSIDNPYERFAPNRECPLPISEQTDADRMAFWLDNQDRHMQTPPPQESPELEYEVGGEENEEADAVDDVLDVEDQAANAENESSNEGEQSANADVQLADPEDEVDEPEGVIPATVESPRRFAEEFEPIPLQDDPEDDELDPPEGAPGRRIDLRAVQQKVAHIHNLIVRDGKFEPFLGYRLPANYNVSHIEQLLAEAGCYPKDTHLTDQEFLSEPVAAWLRELGIYLPNGPNIPPTDRAPSLLGSKTVQVPTRIGYSSPSFTTFVQHHLRILMPSHPLYPSPIDSMCELCHEPYSTSHPPILISDAGGCRNHIFGYQCLRKHLSSNTSVSHKCPKCRTRWFRPRRHEMRDVLRAWAEVDRKEEEAVRREDEAFGGLYLGVRARRVLRDGGLVAWDAAGVMAGEGTKWVLKKMGYGTL